MQRAWKLLALGIAGLLVVVSAGLAAALCFPETALEAFYGCGLARCANSRLAKTLPALSPEVSGETRLIIKPTLGPFGIKVVLSTAELSFHPGKHPTTVVHATSVLVVATPLDFAGSARVDVAFVVAGAKVGFRGTINLFKPDIEGSLSLDGSSFKTTLAELALGPPPTWLARADDGYSLHARLTGSFRRDQAQDSRLAIEQAQIRLGPDSAKLSLVADGHAATAELGIDTFDLDAPSPHDSRRLTLDALLDDVSAALRSLPKDYELRAKLDAKAIRYGGETVQVPALIVQLQKGGVISLPNVAAEFPGGTSVHFALDTLNTGRRLRPNGQFEVRSADLPATLRWLGFKLENFPETGLKKVGLRGQLFASDERIELRDFDLDLDGSKGTGTVTLVPADTRASGLLVAVQASLNLDSINLVDYVPRGFTSAKTLLPEQAVAKTANLAICFDIVEREQKPYVELSRVAIDAKEFALKIGERGPGRLRDLPQHAHYLPQVVAAKIANFATELQAYQHPELLEQLARAVEAGEQFLSVSEWRQLVLKPPFQAVLSVANIHVERGDGDGERLLATASDVSFAARLAAIERPSDGTNLQKVSLQMQASRATYLDWSISRLEIRPELTFRLEDRIARFANAEVPHSSVRGTVVDVTRMMSDLGDLRGATEPVRRLDFEFTGSLHAVPGHLAATIDRVLVGDLVRERDLAARIDWNEGRPRRYQLTVRGPQPPSNGRSATGRPARAPREDCRLAQPKVGGVLTFGFDIDMSALPDAEVARPLLRRLVLRGDAGPGGARIQDLLFELGERSSVAADLAAKADAQSSTIGGCFVVDLATRADFDAFQAFAARTHDRAIVDLARTYDGNIATRFFGQIQRRGNALSGLGTVGVTLGDVSAANRPKALIARGNSTISGGLAMNEAGQLDFLPLSQANARGFTPELLHAVLQRPNSVEVVFSQCPGGACAPLFVSLAKATTTFPARTLTNAPFRALIYAVRLGVGGSRTELHGSTGNPAVSFAVVPSDPPRIIVRLALDNLSEADIDVLRKVRRASLPAQRQAGTDGATSLTLDATIGSVKLGQLLQLFGLNATADGTEGSMTDVSFHLDTDRPAPSGGASNVAGRAINFDLAARLATPATANGFPRCLPERYIAWSADEQALFARSMDGHFKLSGALSGGEAGWSGDVSGSGACLDFGIVIRLLNQAGLARTKLAQEIDQARIDALSFHAAIPRRAPGPLLENLAGVSGQIKWSGRFTLSKTRKLWYVKAASGIDLSAKGGIPVSGDLTLNNGEIGGFVQSIDPELLDGAISVKQRRLAEMHPEIVKILARQNLSNQRTRFEGRVRSPNWKSASCLVVEEIPSYIQDFSFILDLHDLRAYQTALRPALVEELQSCRAMSAHNWVHD